MPKKRFGQHFLTDPRILQRIVEFSAVRPSGTVVEIGPGRGALTRALAAAVRSVIAIEIDRDLIAELRASVPDNVRVIDADALTVDWTRLCAERYSIVANLPYNVATPLIRAFIASRHAIESVTVMLQKEVAGRIAAGPNGREYGPLSVLVQHYAQVSVGFNVRPGAFQPKPRVDSTVIRLDWKPDVADAAGFTAFVHRAFHARRKKLVNSGTGVTAGILAELSISANARPENLSGGEFLRVYERVKAIIPGS